MQNMLIGLLLSIVSINSAFATENSVHAQLLKYTGLTQQATAIAALVTAAAIDNRNRCGSGTTEPLSIVAQQFNALSLLDATSRQMQQQISQAQAVRLLGWFESDLAQRISKLENIGPEAIAATRKTRELIADLARNRSSTTHPRALAILDIVDNTRVADFTAALGSEIEYAGTLASGCTHRAADADTHRYERLRAESIRSDQSLLQQIVGFEAPQEMAQLFQALSDAELQTYRDFTQRPAAQDFYRILTIAFIDSLTAAADEMWHTMQPPDATTALSDE